MAEGKLEAARPALEEAEAALQTIKPAHIATGKLLLLIIYNNNKETYREIDECIAETY